MTATKHTAATMTPEKLTALKALAARKGMRVTYLPHHSGKGFEIGLQLDTVGFCGYKVTYTSWARYAVGRTQYRNPEYRELSEVVRDICEM